MMKFPHAVALAGSVLIFLLLNGCVLGDKRSQKEINPIRPLSPALISAWKKAGFQNAFGSEEKYNQCFTEGKNEAPAFIYFRTAQFNNVPINVLESLPLPSEGFGLCLYRNIHGSSIVLDEEKFRWLANLPHLNSLALDRVQVSDGVLKGIPQLKNLISLDLSYNLVTDADLEGISNLSNLRSLGLALTHVTDRGLHEITRLQNLRSLNLLSTQISDNGLEEISKLKNITELDLSYNLITDVGLVHVGKLSNLTKLNVSFTLVTDEGLEKLRVTLPNCRIIR